MAADFWMFNRDWEGRGADAPRPCAERLQSLLPLIRQRSRRWLESDTTYSAAQRH